MVGTGVVCDLILDDLQTPLVRLGDPCLEFPERSEMLIDRIKIDCTVAMVSGCRHTLGLTGLRMEFFEVWSVVVVVDRSRPYRGGS